MCFTPFIRKDKKTGESKLTSCGKCPDCEKRRIHQWTHRLLQEDRHCISSHFITLTYDTKHAAITRTGNLTLDIHDTQLFWKKVRKHSENNGRCIKYYMVGEYGTDTQRPHYHAIVFNAGYESICASWDKGIVDFGTVEIKSIQYTVGYFSKGSTVPVNSFDDRMPKFATMSKGIGLSYLTPAIINWHKKDLTNRMYVNGSEGKKTPMARYYKDRLYKHSTFRTVIDEEPIDTNYDGADVSLLACTFHYEKYDCKAQAKAIFSNLRKKSDLDYEKATRENINYEMDTFQARKAAQQYQKIRAAKKQKL